MLADFVQYCHNPTEKEKIMKYKLFVAVVLLFFVFSCDDSAMMDEPSTVNPSLFGAWVVEHTNYVYVFKETKYYEHNQYVTFLVTCDITYPMIPTYKTSNCVTETFMRIESDGYTGSYSIESNGVLTITSPSTGMRRLTKATSVVSPYE